MRDDEHDGAMNYGLALAFDTNDPEFARGVEVGKLYEYLRWNPDEEFEQLVHLANAEMVLRIAEALGRPVVSEEHDTTWMTVTFGAAVETPAMG
jgi:hypothetical protein